MKGRPDWELLSKEERLEAIRPLVDRGFSAAKVAQHFQHATRNAIIGYCTRHNVTLRRAAKAKGGARKPKAKEPSSTRTVSAMPAKRPADETRLAFVTETAVAAKPIPDFVALVPISKSSAFDPIMGRAPVRLEELGAGCCHWPVNGLQGLEPIFCGAPASKLYCTSHERLAYAPR